MHVTLNGEDYIHTETMGRSICEAQINGLPVVATNTGGVPEMLIDQNTGIIVEPANIEEIATALQRLIKDKTLRLEFAKSAQHHATNEFGWDSVIRKTLDEIHSIA